MKQHKYVHFSSTMISRLSNNFSLLSFLQRHSARFARPVPGSTHPFWTTKIDIAKFLCKICLVGSLCCSIESLNLLWSRSCKYAGQRISRHLRSLSVSNLHIVPLQNSLPLVRVGIFVSSASAEKKKIKRIVISLLVMRKTDYFCCIFISYYSPCHKILSFWDLTLFTYPKRH